MLELDWINEKMWRLTDMHESFNDMEHNSKNLEFGHKLDEIQKKSTNSKLTFNKGWNSKNHQMLLHIFSLFIHVTLP
jgi:hypothetical protein